VFVAALAVPFDDPALLLALVLALRGGRLALGGDRRPDVPVMATTGATPRRYAR
jgi:hypothetical protein